jgi:hypothetical protein
MLQPIRKSRWTPRWWLRSTTARAAVIPATLAGTLMGTLMCTLGCSETTASGAQSSQLYWKLSLNHHAITVTDSAPYDTITLVATPRTALGAAISTTNPVSYTIRSPGVSVTNGVLRGTAPASQVWVIATMTVDGLTLLDSAVINVTSHTAPVQTLKSLSIQPAPGDSAKVGVTLSYYVNQQVLDVTDAPINNPLVAFSSSDTTIATIDPTGSVTTYRQGQVMLYGETTMYGVTKTDSLLLTVGLPVVAVEAVVSRTPFGSPTMQSYFAPETLAIGVGGYVIWSNTSGQPVDLVFDTPSAAKAVSSSTAFYGAVIGILFGDVAITDSGNVSAFSPADPTGASGETGNRARYFPTAGSYPYHSALYGTTGVIVVQPE